MAVKLRLTRMGAKKRPTYRIVATDSRRSRDGQYLELIGTYSPVGEASTKINEEVALKWLNDGAIPTDTVRNLFSKAGIMKKHFSLSFCLDMFCACPAFLIIYLITYDAGFIMINVCFHPITYLITTSVR